LFLSVTTAYHWRCKDVATTGESAWMQANSFVTGNITFDQFRSKVLFYLWSEVYKDEYGTQNSIFKFEENGNIIDLFDRFIFKILL
jgi:hypothetical protein